VTRIEPYRLFFPIGFVFALLGVAPWPLHAMGWLPYPGAFHRALMMQGFELSFVVGFLLTALPGFTHGPRCHAVELALPALSLVAFAVAIFANLVVPAQAAFLLILLVLLVAAGRRVLGNRVGPPEEFLFVGFGLLLGLIGGWLQLAAALGPYEDPAPRFAERLVSLGMVLSLVLGVGGLLVPVFAGMRNPLVIPKVAGPHERRGRRGLYAALLAVLALAFVAESSGRPGLGAILRAAAASAIGLLVWKLWCLPGRRELPAFVLWGSGWLLLAGLWLAVLLPRNRVGVLHLVFIGGFGLLTLGIGTRVIVAHGKHPLEVERATLAPAVIGAVALALAARVASEFWPGAAGTLIGVSGALWVVAWLGWGMRALPRIVRRGTPT
jgi:uncharacterized protein involved in response to NO